MWYRTIPFKSDFCRDEKWIYINNKNDIKEFPVHVTLGKPVDIVQLKQNVLKDVKKNIEKIRQSRINFFSDSKNLNRVRNCPICGFQDFSDALSVYMVKYKKCHTCDHYFVEYQPVKNALKKFYSSDTSYQKTYADKQTTEVRLRDVAIPKAEWVVKQYKHNFGKEPTSILDVGAGSGHFVKACRMLGYKSDGLELSALGIEFCKKVFNITLFENDFIADYNRFTGYDIITFWGVIEHTITPLKMLSTAYKAFASKEGFLVASVPRWESMSTCIQKQFPNSINRHLDPLGHLHIFSDSSIALSFVKCGFCPTNAWYFGMDFYEMLIQLALQGNDIYLLENNKRIIAQMQTSYDQALLSDEIVLAGISK